MKTKNVDLELKEKIESLYEKAESIPIDSYRAQFPSIRDGLKELVDYVR